MQRIKTYKLFESNKYESFIRDIEDLSLELSDLGIEVKVWSEIDTNTNTPVPNSYKEAIQVNIKKFSDRLLDIKEFVERASDILKDFNVKCFGSSQFKVYQFRCDDIKGNNIVITNLGEYRDVDFYEIYIRFYKPENVYHVVRYNKKRSGWSLVEVNINSEEEAQKVLEEYFNKIKNVYIMEDISLLVISDEEYWDAVGDGRYFRENRRLKYTKKLTESVKAVSFGMQRIKTYKLFESMVDKKIQLLEDLSLELKDAGLQVEIFNGTNTHLIRDPRISIHTNSRYTQDYKKYIIMKITDDNNLFNADLYYTDTIQEFIETLKSYGMTPRSMSGGNHFTVFKFDKWGKMTGSYFKSNSIIEGR